jgi:putative spermidine/putrescine transport system substrate-binding protein
MTNIRMSRRAVLLGSLGIAASSALSACGSSGSGGSAGKKELTMVTWGGTTDAGFKKAIATPFTRATDIPVRMTSPVDYGKYLAQVKNNRITWNWVDFEGWFEVQHKDLWLHLPSDASGDEKDYIRLPGALSPVQPWGVMSGSYSFAIAYRTDMGNSHPTSWAEFFDPQSLAGKRSVYNWPYGMIEVALLGDGVAYDDLYPLDVDRAIGKLDGVRSSLVFWNSGAELQQQLTAGTAPFAFAWNNRVAALAKAGQPVAVEWAENLQDGGWDVTAKADPLHDEVVQLIKFAAQPKNQTNRALATGYSPPTKTALAAIPSSSRKWYNVDDANLSAASGSINLQWWADNFDATIKKWNEWASG